MSEHALCVLLRELRETRQELALVRHAPAAHENFRKPVYHVDAALGHLTAAIQSLQSFPSVDHFQLLIAFLAASSWMCFQELAACTAQSMSGVETQETHHVRRSILRSLFSHVLPGTGRGSVLSGMRCRDGAARGRMRPPARSPGSAHHRHGGARPPVAAKSPRTRVPPTSLRELVGWLQQNPHVRITGPTPESAEPTVREEAFVRMEDGRLWFVALNSGACTSIPIVCVLSERAAQVETGLEFDAAGFTITKFGVPIRVEYER